MRNFIFDLLLCAATLIAFGAADVKAQKLPQAAQITEISLAYTGGRFSAAASSFTIVLRRNGTATFSGAKNSSREGDYAGEFDKKEFIKLAEFIVAQGFFSLNNNYVKDIQDGGMTTTRIAYTGGEKTIRNNSWRKSSGDDRLPDIENAVGAINQRLLIRWKKVKK